MPDRHKMNKKYGNICLLDWGDSIISKSADNLFMSAHPFFFYNQIIYPKVHASHSITICAFIQFKCHLIQN